MIKIIKELVTPLLGLLIPIVIHCEGQRFSKTQLEISQQQFKNDLQVKYLEIFYNDITSNDSLRRLNSVSLLTLMNSDLSTRLTQWIKENPSISQEIKNRVDKDQIHVNIEYPSRKNRYPSKDEIYEFLTWVQEGNISAIKTVLPNKYLTSAKDDQGDDALILATKKGSLSMVKLLKNYGANIATTDSRKYNLLHIALSEATNEGHVQIVKWLMKNGFSPRNKTADGTLPMILVIPAGETSDDRIGIELIELLFANGADPCVQDVFRYRGTTPKVVNLINSKCSNSTNNRQ